MKPGEGRTDDTMLNWPLTVDETTLPFDESTVLGNLLLMMLADEDTIDPCFELIEETRAVGDILENFNSSGISSDVVRLNLPLTVE